MDDWILEDARRGDVIEEPPHCLRFHPTYGSDLRIRPSLHSSIEVEQMPLGTPTLPPRTDAVTLSNVRQQSIRDIGDLLDTEKGAAAEVQRYGGVSVGYLQRCDRHVQDTVQDTVQVTVQDTVLGTILPSICERR